MLSWESKEFVGVVNIIEHLKVSFVIGQSE